MSIMQLVKKKKGKKRPGYRGDDAARSSEGTSGGRADPGGSPRGDGPASGGDGGDRREQRSVATTLGISPTTQSDLGVDRSAVSQFSKFGRNVMAQNLDPRLRFDPRTGGMRKPFFSGLGSTIFGGLLSLINPALGLAFRGFNFLKDKAPETFDKFKSSNTLEEFRDKLRGYGRTMPVTFNNPNFDLMIGGENEEDNIITPMAKPNIFNYNNSVGRFDPNANVNTNNITGASQNMVNADQMSNFFNNQRFMNGGIVDLVDIYDWL